ncbi:fibrinogen-like YCDxxxxGGGW domain-containing protein [Corynebacterium nasicanis]|uniref:Fibrinogen-like YCDxxxxGGGW domain-containing protein n=1 Tax=Corynebacterium nasicanis TaxID=1448267 RepID=A0ABW1QDJ5_9CORY
MNAVLTYRMLRVLGTCVLLFALVAAVLAPARAQPQTPVRNGQSPATAAGSCWDLKQNFPELPSGPYWLLTPTMPAPQEFFCDQEMDGGGWVLIGQGREGWERFPDGRGDVSRLLSRGRSPADFPPAQLPARTIDGLLDGKPVSGLAEGMRVVRARDSAGTRWQTVDMRPTRMTGWSWALPTEDIVAGYRFDNGPWLTGARFEVSFGTDAAWNRVDLSLPASRDYHLGFGYGTSVPGGTTSPGNYLWSRNGISPLPYSELYLRPQISSGDNFARIPDEGTAATAQRAMASNFASPTSWGVTGNLNGRTAEGNAPVQAFAEIGGTVFVGGNFTHAEQRPSRRMEPRSALAAFDAATGELREGFRVEFDNQVKALLALPDGRLLVGGDFKNVNGQRHVATVVLDPVTGEIDPSWTLDITSRLSSGIVSVTSLALGGEFIYVGGNFTHLSANNVANSYSRAAGRVRLDGTPDRSWNPEFNGTVVDIDTDASAAGDRFYAAGYFTRSAGNTAMKAAALSTQPGALPASDWVFTGSSVERSNYQQAIMDTGGLLFVGGSEHSLFGFDPSSLERVSGSITKQLGGDVQAIESDGDIAYAGCHCSHNTYEGAYLWPNMNADWSRVDAIRWLGAWDARTGQQLGEFSPYLLQSNNAGAWSLFLASDGALWVGGDFVGSRTALNSAQWNGGWVRYPARDALAPDTPARVWSSGVTADTVHLRWTTVPDAVGYEILRDDRVVATAPGDSAVVPRGGEDRFFVRAVDAAGNRSASTPVWLAPGEGEEDPSSPVLIDGGAVWQYSYSQGTPAANWNTLDADRSAWAQGAVPIGYGDPGLATAVTPTEPATRPITTWFAHEFHVADPTAFTTATLDYVADDGAVVYLNGQELHRTRMAEGPVDAGTRANAAISTSAAQASRVRVDIPSALLRPGRNVLAAETHLNFRTSPTMSFDASLLITDPNPAPEPEERFHLAEGSTWSYRFETQAPPLGWDTDADLSTWAQGVAPIGWGHAGVVTLLDVPAAQRPRTAYFVKDVTFDPARAPAGAYLRISARADDGALVRLNGQEVGRKRLPPGVVDHLTYADAAVSTAAAIGDPLVIDIPLSELSAGVHRIAVETHLNYRSTPSLTFELSAEVLVP